MKPVSIFILVLALLITSCESGGDANCESCSDAGSDADAGNNTSSTVCEEATGEIECTQAGKTCHWMTGKQAIFTLGTGCEDWSARFSRCFTTLFENADAIEQQYYRQNEETIEVMKLNMRTQIVGWQRLQWGDEYFCTDAPEIFE